MKTDGFDSTSIGYFQINSARFTLQARQAIRDVGRVMNIPARIVDELSKMLKNTPKITLMQAYNENVLFRKRIQSDQKLIELFQMCVSIEGLPRHTSFHAAGIVL